MAIRNVRLDGDEILRKMCRPVENIDDKIKELVADMIETMHAQDGVGLAAPQVGILKRVVVMIYMIIKKHFYLNYECKS